MEYLKYLTDQSIMGFIQIVKSDYAILFGIGVALFGGPLVWLIRKYTDWTPWRSDDNLDEEVAEKLNIKDE